MNGIEYQSIPEFYMKEIPKDVWETWPIEIRRQFFQMISDPNSFFFNYRPFNQVVYGNEIELSDLERKKFWKHVDYFFANLGITNLQSLDNLWGYFAIPFEHRVGRFLKYYFYLPKNKRKLFTTLSYYNVANNSNQSSLVKTKLIEQEAQVFILSYIRDYIHSFNQRSAPDLILKDDKYLIANNRNFITGYNSTNDNQLYRSFPNPGDNRNYNQSSMEENNKFSHTNYPKAYLSNSSNFNNPHQNIQVVNDPNENQLLENGENDPKVEEPNNEDSHSDSQSNINQTPKRGRGRPRKYPIQEKPPDYVPKKRGRKKKIPVEEIDNSIQPNSQNTNKEIINTKEIEEDIKQSENEDESENYNYSEDNESYDEYKDAKKYASYGTSDSYDFIDDEEDDDYKENIQVKTIKKKKKRIKNHGSNLRSNAFTPIDEKMRFSENGQYMNPQRFSNLNQYNANKEYNGFSNGNNNKLNQINQVYHDGRYSHMVVINAHPPINIQQQQHHRYPFEQPPQFIKQENMNYQMQPQSQPQLRYNPNYQIQNDQIANNFHPVPNLQSAQEMQQIQHFAPMKTQNIPNAQNPVQLHAPPQIQPFQQTKMHYNNYQKQIPLKNDFPHPNLQEDNKHKYIDINQGPVMHYSDTSSNQQYQPNKMVQKIVMGKIDNNMRSQNIIYPPARNAQITPNNIIEREFQHQKISPYNNSQEISPYNNYQITYPGYKPNNTKYIHPPSSQAPHQSVTYIRQQQQTQGHNQRQNLGNEYKEEVRNENKYKNESDYDSYAYSSDYGENTNSDSDEKLTNPQNSRMYDKPSASSESVADDDSVSTNNNEYDESENDDKKYGNLLSSYDMEKRRSHERKHSSNESEYSSDTNDSEPAKLTGIISSLSYFYEENDNTEGTRVAKTKPSSLIDLEFKDMSS